MIWTFFIPNNRGMRLIMVLFLSIISFRCDNLYTDSMDPVKNFPLPAFIGPYSAKGIPDISFGNDGIATGMEIHDEIHGSYGKSIVTDNYGNIYIAGTIQTLMGSELILWRFKPDGLPDTNFGTNGYIRTQSKDIDDAKQYFELAYGMTIDSAGIIYIVGLKKTADYYRMCIWKYDDLAGNNKLEIFTMFDFFEYDPSLICNVSGLKIKIDSKGRIVVLGMMQLPDYSVNIIIWRYNRDGLLDNSFNSTGVLKSYGSEGGRIPAKISYPGGIAFDYIGRILVCGALGYVGDSSSDISENSYIMSIWRFNENGTPDATFGSGGLVTNDGAAMNNQAESSYVGMSIVIDSKNRILMAGKNINGDNPKMVVLCYKEKGELDETFTNNGIIIVNNSNDPYDYNMPSTIVLDSRNRLLVSGYCHNGIFFMRYYSNGMLDHSFGSSGVLKYEIPNAEYFGLAMTCDNKGRILFVEGTAGDDNQHMTLWRYR